MRVETPTQENDLRRKTQMAFFLPNLDGGGAERAIVRLVNDIADLGVTVDLVLGEAVGVYLAEVSPKVRIINLTSRGKLRVLLRLTRYLRQHRPSVVMSSMDIPNIQMILAAKLSGFKGRTVISQRATIAPVYAEAGWIRRLVYGIGIRFTYPYATAIISNSYAATSEIHDIAGVSEKRVFTIHNSVDADRINRLAKESLSDVWLLKSSVPLVISVGSLTLLKDRVTLVRAFAIVKAQRNVRLVILGEGSERKNIEKTILDIGLSADVYLPGFDANPFKWIRQSAVLVSSSVTEGCPNNLLEALSLGISIVATDCPGDTSELLGHGRWGRLVPVAESESMASAILASLDDPNPPDGRIRAADFMPEKTMRAYLDVLLPGFNPRQVPGLQGK